MGRFELIVNGAPVGCVSQLTGLEGSTVGIMVLYTVQDQGFTEIRALIGLVIFGSRGG